MKTSFAPYLLTMLAAAAPATARQTQTPNEALRWNQIATDALAAHDTDPLTESRVLAIVHVAVHDALNAIEARSRTYLEVAPAAGPASPEAAIAAAAHDALVQLVPASKVTFDEELVRSLQPLAADSTKSLGVDVGRRSAAAILALRAGDGADRKIDWKPGTKPGEYRPTPPDFTPAGLPHWGNVAPFALRTGAQFRPAAPPAVDGAVARGELEELRRLGGQAESERTAEQSEIARYWYENSTQGWNRVARVVAQSHALDSWDSARLLALVNLAMADGFIAGFDAKYHYNYWRPATALRESGASDWLSYLQTPPVPDYPSTHTVLGAAAATALARFFGTDFVPFEMTSGAPYGGITRKFWSFSEAAHENGASRVFAGLHFPTAVRVGYALGEQVGAWVSEHALLPRDAKAAPVAASTAARR